MWYKTFLILVEIDWNSSHSLQVQGTGMLDKNPPCWLTLMVTNWKLGIVNKLLVLVCDGRKEGNFYLTTHSTHFIYGYMASDIWLRTILIVREETRCCHIGYSFRLAARVLLYAPFHRQDNTYHSLCYTSRGALAGTRNSSMGPPHEGLIRWPIAPWVNTLNTELHLAPGPWQVVPRPDTERKYWHWNLHYSQQVIGFGKLCWQGAVPKLILEWLIENSCNSLQVMGSGLLEKEFMMTDGRFRSNRVKASSINKLVLACDGHNNGRHKTDIRGRKEDIFYFMMHSTHFIYSYMVSGIW